MTRPRRLLPQPTPETQPFWDATKRHELWIQQCQDCQKHYFYPRPYCPHCLSANTQWVRASGRGRLHTFSINHRPAPGFEEVAPYIIAVVELAEGPRMMTNLVGVDPDPAKLSKDMPVEVVFQDVTAEITLPLFRPVTPDAGGAS